MRQFIKLPNSLKEEALDIQALWALTAGCLKNPDYNGNLTAVLSAFIPSGAPFAAVLKRLRRKYLKMVQLPMGQTNRFEARYELYQSDRPDLPDVQHLTSAAARKYILKQPKHKVCDSGYFTAVPTDVLKDGGISLKAKGLYISICRLFSLARNVKNDDIIVSKNEIMRRCKLSEGALRTPWEELKRAGYLHQRRYFEPTTGYFAWGYELFETPQKEKYVARLQPISRDKKQLIEADKPPKDLAVNKPEREALRHLLRENIEYDTLCANAGIADDPHYPYYELPQLDSLVDIMLYGVVCDRRHLTIKGILTPTKEVRERFLALTADDIVGVLSSLQGKQPSNPFAYKLTALYNAVHNR